jgi:hypothetical protein
MQKILFLVAFSLFFLVFNLACTKTSVDSDRTAFAVMEDDVAYEISASYNRSKISSVQKVMNENVLPTTVFTSDSDNFSKLITLNDDTQFEVKTSPGNLLIKLDKNANSNSSLERIRALMSKIKEVLN